MSLRPMGGYSSFRVFRLAMLDEFSYSKVVLGRMHDWVFNYAFSFDLIA